MTRKRFGLMFLFLTVLSFGVRSIPMLIKQTWKPENKGYLFETDSPGYELIAINMMQKGWHNAQDTSRTPLYPFFIAEIYKIAGRTPFWVILAQIFLMSLSTGFLLWIGEVMGDTSAGFIAGLIWAISPAAMIYTNIIYTEPLFTFIFLIATLVLLKALASPYSIILSALSGVFFALGTLTRPIGTFVPFILALSFFVLSRISVKKMFILSLVFLTAYGLILAPRIIQMKEMTGGYMVSGMYDHNFHEIYDYMDYYLPNVKPFDEHHPHLIYRVGHFFLKSHIDPYIHTYNPAIKYTTAEDIKYWEALAMDKVLRYPGVFAKMYFKGLFTLFLTPASNDFFNALNLSGHRIEFGVRSGTSYLQNIKDLFIKKSLFQLVYIVVGFCFSVLVYAFFIYGASQMWHEKHKAECIVLVLPLIVFTIFIGTHGTLRYREPMEPFILLVSAIGFDRIRKRPRYMECQTTSTSIQATAGT